MDVFGMGTESHGTESGVCGKEFSKVNGIGCFVIGHVSGTCMHYTTWALLASVASNKALPLVCNVLCCCASKGESLVQGLYC